MAENKEVKEAPGDNSKDDKKTQDSAPQNSKGAGKSGVAQTTEKKGRTKKVTSNITAIFKALFSDQWPSRIAAAGFIFSLFGIAWITANFFGILGKVNVEKQNIGAGGNLGKFIEQESEKAHIKYSKLDLGTFTIELNVPKGLKRPPSVLSIAEVKVLIECDKKATCKFLEDNMPVTRDKVTDVFLAMDHEDIMSTEVKNQLKDQITKILNSFVTGGKVLKVYFTELVIS